MNTDPKSTAQQLRLAADILETGHPWEYRDVGKTEWRKGLSINSIISSPVEYEIRPILATPSDGLPLHNPDNLTAEQVGAGYRLLCKGESDCGLPKTHPGHRKCEGWDNGLWNKGKDNGSDSTVTYRLPLSVPWPEPADPYAKLKAAHAAGKVIQVRRGDGSYLDIEPDETPAWGAPVTEYRIKPEPAFQLPPPPPGMQWHRTDGWQEGDLPQGMRPMMVDEKYLKGDEWKMFDGWQVCEEDQTIQVWNRAAHSRTRRPLTFTYAGKTWTWHRPGDPMPCDGELIVEVVLVSGSTSGYKKRGDLWLWNERGFDSVLGWRYADEKKTVPLGPEDVPPGSVFRWPECSWVVIDLVCGKGISTTKHGLIEWKTLDTGGGKINRSIPLTGKWNPDAWEPCHKIVSENG